MQQGGTSQSGETDSGTKEYKNFITVDVYDEFANYQGIQSGWFAKEVRDRFNMELNIIAPNVTGGRQHHYHAGALQIHGDRYVLEYDLCACRCI